MNDQQKLIRIDNGRYAEELRNNPLLNEILDALDIKAVAEVLRAKDDTSRRDGAAYANAVRKFRAKLTDAVKAGKCAEK
ncbi:MAG: hypothetical protein JKY96_04825 [Phycisphaerales bacterium]|nr:hypothetical protein [Phycisphaerales bacterium]